MTKHEADQAKDYVHFGCDITRFRLRLSAVVRVFASETVSAIEYAVGGDRGFEEFSRSHVFPMIEATSPRDLYLWYTIRGQIKESKSVCGRLAPRDLAIAVFHSGTAEEALKVLDGISPDQRKGDYFLLRAQILDAMNKYDQAVEALNRGFASAPTRADLYFQAAVFLFKHAQYKQAIRILEQASRALPDAPELQLLLAMAYEMVRYHDQTLRILAHLESRWPEWALPYMVQGITLAIRLRSEEARPVLENAIALRADNGTTNYEAEPKWLTNDFWSSMTIARRHLPESIAQIGEAEGFLCTGSFAPPPPGARQAADYLALVIVNSTPERIEEAHDAISKALRATPDDFYVQSLAGKIDYLRKDYASALKHLNAALHLWPGMAEAHETLAGVYRALGDKEKSIAELQEIVRSKQLNRSADQVPPFPVRDLLFTVHAPSSRI